MVKKKIRVGIDFDGVLAYNPFRIIRAPITFVKRAIFKKRKLSFYIPKTGIEKFVWIILHESSILPAIGTEYLKVLSKRNEYEFYIITARFHFLQPGLVRWLKRNGLHVHFKAIHMNIHDKQPHVHKFETIEELKLDYFIEDNWDIVNHLRGRSKTRILWIYNIIDRNIDYPYKFPYLRKALEHIAS